MTPPLITQPRAQRTEPRSAEPFAGVDRGGMPTDLATAETNTWRRFSPRRNRWSDVAAFDERVAAFEFRRTEISAELADLLLRRSNAPVTDADTLANWHLEGCPGNRPESELPAIEQAILERQGDLEGLDAAITKVLADKAAFVAKHRKRLVREADHQAAEAHARLSQLIDDVAATRQELADLRQASVWAALYPNPSAMQEAQHALLAGGLRKPIEHTLGVTHQVEAHRIWQALHSDADWLREACTAQQKTELQGAKPGVATEGALWGGTPEAVEQERAEKKAALKRYVDMWGREPA